MPTSKWFDELAEMWDWMEADEGKALHDLVFHPTITTVTKNKEEQAKGIKNQGDGKPEIPDVLPILPLRGVVVYPQTGVPLTIGQPRSVWRQASFASRRQPPGAGVMSPYATRPRRPM